jgi:hypothetical protein
MVLWRPELIPIALTLDAAPDGFSEAKPVDPDAFARLLAQRLCDDGRHVVIEDATGEHRLWLADPAFATGTFVQAASLIAHRRSPSGRLPEP